MVQADAFENLVHADLNGHDLRGQALLKPRHHFSHRFAVKPVSVLADYASGSAIA
jgi:hypothetical protein